MQRIVYALLVLLLATPAAALCPTESMLSYLKSEKKGWDLNHMNEVRLKECIYELRSEIEKRDEKIEQLQAANGVAWTAFRDASAVFQQVQPLDHLIHDACDDISTVIQAAYDEVSRTLSGRERNEASAAIEAYRKRFLKVEAFKLLFADKTFWKRLVEEKATVQLAVRCLTKTRVLLEKPFNPLLAALAGAWYREQCDSSTPPVPQREGVTECTVPAFREEFQKHYGVEPNPTLSYALAWLNRRHREGGNALVAAVQSVGLSIAREIAPEVFNPTPQAVAPAATLTIPIPAPKKK